MEPENTTLVALRPSDMAPAQAGLADWCEQKMRSLGKDYSELNASLKIATRNRWGSRQTLAKQVSKTKQRINYYRKIRAAVKLGYVVVPNFDIDVFAVRVDNASPRWRSDSHDSFRVTHAEPKLLAPGEGRYVSGNAEINDNRREVPVDKPVYQGQTRTVGNVSRVGYIEEIDLPLLELKPQILESIELALAQKVFDRIGIVKHQKRSDPIVVGQLIDPRGNHPLFPQVISFFIAWWLDTSVL